MRKIKKRRSALTWIVIIAVSLFLFALASGSAYQQRGYAALGGELLVLAVPTVCYILGRFVRSIIRDFKGLYDAAPEE